MDKRKTYINLDKLMAICKKIKSTNYSKYGIINYNTILITHFWLATDNWIYMLKEEIENES